MVCVSLGGMVALKQFYLDESLDWNVSTYKEWNSYLAKDVVTSEDLVEVIKGKGHCSITGDDDGPEFKALRNQLEADGYIRCERSWWNGDRVLRAFKLNGVTFRKHDQFSCGAAMKHHLRFTRKHHEQKTT
jgi:hypothetical protein